MLDVFFFPVLGGLWGVRISLHGLGSWFPLSWANLSMLVRVLEGLDEADELVDVTADWEVVVGGVSEDALVIDDEGGSVWNSGVGALGDQTAINSRNSFCDISQQRDGDIAEAALVSCEVAPLEVAVLRVARGSDQGAVELGKLVVGVGKGENLSWADESEVQRVEEEADPLALVVSELDIFEVLLLVSRSLEVRGRLAHDCSWANVVRLHPSVVAVNSRFISMSPTSWATTLLLVFVTLSFHLIYKVSSDSDLTILTDC